MKALTVRQPWAWAIVHVGKDVENRTQAWTYRGPLAIHAALAPDTAAQGHWPPRHLVPSAAWRVRGAIIGVVDLVDVHDGDACSPCSAWADPEAGVHLVLANPRPLRTPIPAKGRLGLWTLDGEQLAALVGTGVLSGMECA